MSEYDFVKSARSNFKKKALEPESDDEDSISTYQVIIDIKVKTGKNKKHLPPTADILNWCGNILSSTKS